MRVGEVRPGAAELCGAGIHPVHEGGNGAAYVFADDVAGFVCRGQQRTIEQVLERHGLARDDAGGAAVVHHAFKAGLTGGDAVRQRKLTFFDSLDRDEDRHDLRQRGGVCFFIRVFLIEHAAGIRIHEDGGLAAHLRLLQGEGLGRQHGGKQDDYQKYGQQAYFFHINLRNNVLS